MHRRRLHSCSARDGRCTFDNRQTVLCDAADHLGSIRIAFCFAGRNNFAADGLNGIDPLRHCFGNAGVCGLRDFRRHIDEAVEFFGIFCIEECIGRRADRFEIKGGGIDRNLADLPRSKPIRRFAHRFARHLHQMRNIA